MRPMPEHISNTIPEITRRFRGERTMISFAGLVGANTRQIVDNWEKGRTTPDVGFLYQVVVSNPNASARAWARECLRALEKPVPPETQKHPYIHPES